MNIKATVTKCSVALGVAALLSGCAYFAAINFHKDSRSQVGAGQVTVTYVTHALPRPGGDVDTTEGTVLNGLQTGAFGDRRILLEGGQRFEFNQLFPATVSEEDAHPTIDRVRAVCFEEREPSGTRVAFTDPATAIVATLIGFGIQQSFSFAADYLAREVERLQRAGTAPFRAGLIDMSPSDFLQPRGCLFVVRSPTEQSYEQTRIEPAFPVGESSSEQCPGTVRGPVTLDDGTQIYDPGFIAAFAIETPDQSGNDAYVRLVPIFACMNSSLAATGVGDKVKVTLAIVGRAPRLGSRGNPVVSTVFESTYDFGEMAFGQPLSLERLRALPAPVLAAPSPNDSTLEISVAGVETGSSVPNAKAARASIEALALALGGAISTAVRNEILQD